MKLWQIGDLKGAFRGFSSAAMAGDDSAQLNLGYFFDEGLGVRKDLKKAMRWYKRAYANGNTSAAGNIAIVYREQGKIAQAIVWFKRALSRGDDDSALELGKLYLSRFKNRERALKYLKRAAESDSATPATNEEAQNLLRGVSSPPSGLVRGAITPRSRHASGGPKPVDTGPPPSRRRRRSGAS